MGDLAVVDKVPDGRRSGRPFGKGTTARSRPSSSQQQQKGKQKEDSALNLSGTTLSAPLSFKDHPHLRKLDLSNCGLSSLGFVRELRRSLTWLNVSQNNLRSTDAWDGVNELTGLFVLNASECQLTEVPSVVEVLHSLKALVMTHNSLKKLDHVKGLRDLNTIVVSNNKLVSLPSTLATLPSLKKISAAHNQLSASSLPDLSSLSQLREVKLNDNRTLTSLPPHFATWGKANQAGSAQSKRPPGLEIVDLGNCGFQDWFALKELASQSGIVNLGLKGTKVEEEAMADSGGFEAFKSKIKILLPLLRILDGHRFDAKFKDLKARRDARAPEEKVLDAGPMGLAINAAKAEPLAISQELIEKRERARREREMRKRQKLERHDSGAPEQGEHDGQPAMEIEEVPGAANDESKEVADPKMTAEAAPAAKKRNKKRRAETQDADPAPATAEGGLTKKKKRKNRHEAKREDEHAGDATAPSKEANAEHGVGNSSTVEAPPRKKRGRVSKDPTRAPPLPRETRPVEAAERPKKERREKGSLLSELQGDGTEAAAAKVETSTVQEPAEKATPAQSKQKTSVLKVVEVQQKKDNKDKGKKYNVGDVGALLGLSAPKDAAAGAAGVFGSGWD